MRELVWADTAVRVLDGEVGSVAFVEYQDLERRATTTYVAISPGLVFPVINFSHASAHSRTTSVAYLSRLALIK